MYKMNVIVIEYSDLTENLKEILKDKLKYNMTTNGCYIDIDKCGEFNKLKFASVQDFDNYIYDELDIYSKDTIFLYRELCKMVSEKTGGAHDKVFISYCW